MIRVPEMPLYWRFKDKPGNSPGDPPARAPFGFDYNPALDLIIEQRSPALTSLLTDIYSRDANVGFLQDGHSSVQNYGADFWRFLSDVLKEFSPRSIVEIGCGGCVLLERLKNEGFSVTGVDPSPVAVKAGHQKGIPIVAEFLSRTSLAVQPDMIFQVDVLEHIEDPVAFLELQADCITGDGLIVVNVPDSTRSIERGDISMALHQHVNMYDAGSLSNVFHAAGLEIVKLERAKYGSGLYCVGRKGRGARTPVKTDPTHWERFNTLGTRALGVFHEHVGTARKAGGSIGFFMPQRAFPYLGTLGWFEGFRVFDNMNFWHRRYLDGLDIPIENQADLIAAPVDHLFIMSLTFGDEVASALRREAPAMKTVTLQQMLAV